MDKAVVKDSVPVGFINTAVVVLGAAMGLLASLGLLETELGHLRDPDGALGCDLNSLISCGSSLMSPQAHLLTVPNSALGIAAFGALVAIGAVMLLGTRLSKPATMLLGLGSACGLVFVGYFLYQSATNFFALCPYCMVVWSATIIVSAVLIPAALTAFEGTRATGKTMLRYSWATIVCLHLVVFIIVLFTMTEQIGALL
ncbi:vitamin K epoxide reductase family protein [Gleimia europaea]|uniref:vitamin K epoxide reductase family protein n=1 Tax=Gleimia europaea TaxID=66228 RepID=UPI002784F3B0|nr:vitamin K epoxide reductase family protein [Gleimia europaea]MDP9834741.1 putative membrane protein [Gleimia europaea]